MMYRNIGATIGMCLGIIIGIVVARTTYTNHKVDAPQVNINK